MPGISDEDYRSLEKKVHTEITKVFSQFLEDLEQKTARPGIPRTARELQKPVRPQRLVTAETIPASAGQGKRPSSKKSIDTNKILQGFSPARIHLPVNPLESDMAKIFRKKRRRGSH